MDRIITYHITEQDAGLRIEQYLRRRGYSRQNLVELKKMPESILVNGVWYYLTQTLSAGDLLKVHIQETESSEKIPPTKLPLTIVYEDEDILVVNKPAGMPIHEQLSLFSRQCACLVLSGTGKAVYFPLHEPFGPGYFRTDRHRQAYGQFQHPVLPCVPP